MELEIKLRPLGMPCTVYTVMINNDFSAGLRTFSNVLKLLVVIIL
jgi:hypothetical protein